jgi:hypothetical protein
MEGSMQNQYVECDRCPALVNVMNIPRELLARIVHVNGNIHTVVLERRPDVQIIDGRLSW